MASRTATNNFGTIIGEAFIVVGRIEELDTIMVAVVRARLL